MSLLELQGVHKRYREGDLERFALRDLDLTIDAGELAIVWGLRGSGRSTLLRIAAGIELPDAGIVRFDGSDLAQHREELLGAGIGFCQKTLPANGSQSALDLVMVSLLARGISSAAARSLAGKALERTGAVEFASLSLPSLDVAETVRVALARVLALSPRLLVIDDPIGGVDLIARDDILVLLRQIADDGVAVLASTGESTALSGSDRTLTLSDGQLRGPPPAELAPVLPLRRASARQAGA